MACLDDNLVLALVEGEIAPGAAALLDEHLDECDRCRELVAAVARTEPSGERLEQSEPTGTGAGASAKVPRVPDVGRAGDAVGEYVLEKIVGVGGMGVVWAARDRATGGRVAIKFLRIDDPVARRRQLREARIATDLVHPNIVRVREVVERGPDEPPALVMDLVEGETLEDRLHREGRLSPRAAAPILAGISRAVAAAHAQGVVHRDLKPLNVLLSVETEVEEQRPGGREARTVVQPRVVDFGVAKRLDDVKVATGSTWITRTGMVLGTPHYMAPEQIFGERDVDQRVDLWSLGVIAYRVLGGALPVGGRKIGSILKHLTSGSITPLSSIAPEVPPAILELVSRLLVIPRDQRNVDLDEAAEIFAAAALDETCDQARRA
jgi:serine/threonine-protein kinase